MKLNYIKINLPLNFNFVILNKFNTSYIYSYNTEFKFKIKLKNINNLKLNKNLNYLEYKNFFLKKNFYILNNLNFYFFEKINYYFFTKIKFKGKGYKIGFYKNKKIINFFFGKSHKSIFIYKNTLIKKLGKYKFILLKNNKNDLIKISNKTINIKKINFYTGRGLRKSRQLIIKRKGKKGSFI